MKTTPLQFDGAGDSKPPSNSQLQFAANLSRRLGKGVTYEDLRQMDRTTTRTLLDKWTAEWDAQNTSPLAEDLSKIVKCGFYEFGGDIFKVVESRSSGHRYAKVLAPKSRWIYSKGTVLYLTPEMEISADDPRLPTSK